MFHYLNFAILVTAHMIIVAGSAMLTQTGYFTFCNPNGNILYVILNPTSGIMLRNTYRVCELYPLRHDYIYKNSCVSDLFIFHRLYPTLKEATQKISLSTRNSYFIKCHTYLSSNWIIRHTLVRFNRRISVSVNCKLSCYSFIYLL
jgi:hypothetical protein